MKCGCKLERVMSYSDVVFAELKICKTAEIKKKVLSVNNPLLLNYQIFLLIAHSPVSQLSDLIKSS